MKVLTFLGILILVVLSAIALGIMVDLATIQVSRPFFDEIDLPLVFGDYDTAVAVVCGFVTSWWMGLCCGIPLAAMVTFGKSKSYSLRKFLRFLFVGWILDYGIAMLLIPVFWFAGVSEYRMLGIIHSFCYWFAGCYCAFVGGYVVASRRGGNSGEF
jgi:hypothetical protein